ncbi:MAG: alpha/beta hydrolase [Acidobacteriota bacterium]
MNKRNIAIGIGGAVGAAIAVKLLTRAKGVDWDRVAELVPHSENSHFIIVDGATVHYQEFGDPGEPTLLLIHGYTASVYVWNTTAPVLADNGFHVIAIDLIGFGYSEKPAWFDYSIPSQARMIARFMDRLGIGRATIVGSSYGAAVAAILALDYAERVEKLVVVDAVCNDRLKDHPLLRLASIRGIGELVTPFIVDSRRYLRQRMHGTLAKVNHYLIDDERIDAVMRPLRAADAHHSLLATSRNWSAERVSEDAHLIRQPTLIVWGEDDTVTPIEDGFELHSSILNSRLVVIRECGHVPQEEKSDLFAGIVAEFCRDRKGRLSRASDAEMTVEN